jgi:hypothetical protein
LRQHGLLALLLVPWPVADGAPLSRREALVRRVRAALQQRTSLRVHLGRLEKLPEETVPILRVGWKFDLLPGAFAALRLEKARRPRTASGLRKQPRPADDRGLKRGLGPLQVGARRASTQYQMNSNSWLPRPLCCRLNTHASAGIWSAAGFAFRGSLPSSPAPHILRISDKVDSRMPNCRTGAYSIPLRFPSWSATVKPKD